MEKSLIRQKIETILKKEFNAAWIDSRKNGNFRMKLYSNKEATLEQEKRILRLPNVINVKYIDSPNSFCPGICVYFDKRPKLIKIN